ncbi:TonB-dependent receptor plug domain-containing protein [Mucilaginibacter glaciei]|uniref:TonB-dependent receptor n=1 Tax=Mucilaginibacter glaciei TaxID=2772109 RepID=A0A926NUS6_9SPHI|nr:TonB-dependent receptor [Mucilaginibacter glaciei]MBD1392119.1 TonB-dependent receptor [Mucilaginibacter glaciei]
MKQICLPGLYNSIPAKKWLVILTCFIATNTFAQSDTTKKLKQVMVTGNLAPKVETLTPTQQLSRTDFTRYNAFNVADAIRNFSGVNIKDYGGIGGLKTISVRSLGANHTAVLFDGVQLNDAQNGQIDLSKFNLSNVQEIALFIGQPENLLQPARSFASASVLSIKTVKPVLTQSKLYQVQAGIKSGSFGLANTYLQWQQRINKQWAIIANANYVYANGRYKYKVDGDGSDTLAVRRNGEVKSIQTDAALYWTKSDSNKFNIHLNYYGANRGLPGAVIFYNPYSSQRLENNDFFVQATYERTWNSSLQLLLNSKLSQVKTRYLDPIFFNQQGFLDQHYIQKEEYQSVALAYQLTSNWKISYSTDASLIKMDADIYNYAYPSRFTLLNVLATNYRKGKWQLQGNLLYTYLKETVERGSTDQPRSVLSPTLMATFKPLPDSNFEVRGFYKSIFRPATLDELYFYAIVPRAIKPEFVKQYNMGFTWTKNLNNLLDYITLTTDAYYNDVTNKILAVPNQNPAIFSFSNIGKVAVKGIDIGLKTQTPLHNNWRGLLSANFTYQQATDKSDPTSSSYNNQIPYTPKNTLALNAGVNYRRVGVCYNQILSTGRYYTGNNTPDYFVPGYAISDVSAAYKFVTGKLPVSASVEVNNLFNENYAIIRSFPMPGRSYRLSFQITI